MTQREMLWSGGRQVKKVIGCEPKGDEKTHEMDCKWTPSLLARSTFLRQIKRNLNVCDDAMVTKSYTKQHFPFVVVSLLYATLWSVEAPSQARFNLCSYKSKIILHY